MANEAAYELPADVPTKSKFRAVIGVAKIPERGDRSSKIAGT